MRYKLSGFFSSQVSILIVTVFCNQWGCFHGTWTMLTVSKLIFENRHWRGRKCYCPTSIPKSDMDFFSLATEIYNHGQCECVCVFILPGCVCLGEEHCNIRVLNYSSVAVKFSHYMCRIHFRGERDVFSCKGKSSHMSYRKITWAVSHSNVFPLCSMWANLKRLQGKSCCTT